MNLAINMYNNKIMNSALQRQRIDAISSEINKKPLPSIPQYAIRNIPDPSNNLLKRNFSYIPGSQAYPEVRHHNINIYI